METLVYLTRKYWNILMSWFTPLTRKEMWNRIWNAKRTVRSFISTIVCSIQNYYIPFHVIRFHHVRSTCTCKHHAVLMLNINGFKVDRSNLKRIFAAHIAKDEQSMKNPNELMSRRHIDPLVDTLLKHFGKARSGGCFSDNKKTKKTSVVPQNIAAGMRDSMSKREQPLGPSSRSLSIEGPVHVV